MKSLEDLQSIARERERLLDELESVRDSVPAAISKARADGLTIAQCAGALGISPQALHKSMKQIPDRNKP